MARINDRRRTVISILLALAVAVTFIPVTGQFAFAEEGGTVPDNGTVSVEQPVTEPAAEPVSPQPATQPAPAFDTQKQVKGLKVKSYTYKSVKIGWTAYPKAKGYEIWRADKKNGSYKKIKTLSSCSYNDKGNKTLGKYKYYKVRAYATVGGAKKYSKYSSVLAAKPNLPAPKNVTTTGVTAGVKVKWSGVTGAKKYQVYRAKSKNGKYKKIKTTKSKSYTDKSVADGKRYYYKVRAYRKVKKKKKYGVFSSRIEGMALLGCVGNLSVTVGKTGAVTATWSAKTGASGYQLQRAPSGGKYVTVATTKALSGKDTLKVSGSYVYRVRAYAVVNGKTQYGAYSAGGRGNALAKAQSWVGCKESNGSHKKIIDVFNNYGPACGKLSYSAPWCAAFVSAVAISTNNTAVIPVHSYCPAMLSNFQSKTYNKKYTPQGADVIFFDWNYNKVPDHVGMVEKTVGNNVTTIEGNYSDSVKRRTFKKGYSLLLAYGLPKYSVRNAVSYTAPASTAGADKAAVNLACLEVSDALEEGEALAAAEAEEAAAVEAPAAAGEEEPADAAEPTEMETAEEILDYVQEEAPAEEAGVPAEEESTYDAFLVYEVCDEMDIDACVITITDPDGTERSYNEVVLDGELYVFDAAGEGAIEKYIPEEIN